jgi:hypothetical protein
MRRLVSVVLAASSVTLMAACGSGGDGETSADSIVLPTKAPRTETTETTDSTTPIETISTGVPDATTSETGTDADEPLVTPIELDPCLVGEWTVSIETISQLIAAAVLPVPDLTVPVGGFTVTLNDDGTVLGDADFTAAFSLGGVPSEADVRWSGSGTWSTFDGTATLSLDEQSGGLTAVRIGGTEQADSSLEADIPLSGGPYTCTPNRLDVSGTAGSTTIPLVFER